MLIIDKAAGSVAHRNDFTHGLIVAGMGSSAAESGEVARTLPKFSLAAIMSEMTQLGCLQGVGNYYCGYILKISKHRCVKLQSVATNPVQFEKNLKSGSSAGKSF